MSSEKLTVKIACDTRPLEVALASLSDLANGFDEVVNRFLGGLDSHAQLVRVDEDVGAATGANEVRITLQPSDLLCDFLAALGTVDVERVRV
jgi:hypothetical protein